MTFAKILIPIPDRADIENAAKLAFALAAQFEAEVEGLYATVHPRDQFIIQDEAGAPFQLEALMKEAEAQAAEAEKKVREQFDALTGSHPDINTSFVARKGNIPSIVARRARVSDLVVIGRFSGGNGDPWLDIRESALFQSGRPVITVPDGEVPPDTGKTVVIGWKDSLEAARAVGAAKPFISRAERVRVIAVGDESADEQSLASLQDYLSHFSPNVEVARIGEGKRNTGELIAKDAAEQDSPLLVIGAYSHWRWKEWAFGGVTEYMLHSAGVPVLMAH